MINYMGRLSLFIALPNMHMVSLIEDSSKDGLSLNLAKKS